MIVVDADHKAGDIFHLRDGMANGNTHTRDIHHLQIVLLVTSV